MRKFAIIENGIVFNTIIADTIETAQELFPGMECVGFTDEQENKPILGLGYENGVFQQSELENETIDEESSTEEPVAEETPEDPA